MKVAVILFAGLIAAASSAIVKRQAPSTINIDTAGALAAAGSGWAAENHADNVQVIGAGGWEGPNAELALLSEGQSIVAQDGSILQVTSQDGENVAGLQSINVGQIAEGSEGQAVIASGLDISNQQSGWAAGSGEGASAADGVVNVNVNTQPGLGLARP